MQVRCMDALRIEYLVYSDGMMRSFHLSVGSKSNAQHILLLLRVPKRKACKGIGS